MLSFVLQYVRHELIFFCFIIHIYILHWHFFQGAYPYFLAKDSQNVVYKFCVNNSHCFETNALIKVYCDLDERCKQLGLLFRKMAKVRLFSS